ncbi:MAG: hypothetical protein IJ308_08775 [Clostridia bacterium]|nr:hypothetical protein [Clostridia bacterium]
MSKITVDTGKTIGKIRPMHAVNNGPVAGAGRGKFEFLKEAGIPYARTHDTGGQYGASVYVDIENIFRNFDADVNDPASYDFAFTDWLFERYEENGTKPFYRLGCTIENQHAIKAYRIYPPKDNLKWAQICEHIILHYNEGWANGYRYGIEYWEIWNEPDNEPEIADNPMWKGTKEQFFELYATAASYLKGKFPKLKIGGYASCGFYKIAQIEANPNANISPRIDYFVEFFHDFLQYITDEKHKAPLDFFSWHSYANLEANVIFSNYARKTLDEYGFIQTEQLCNEWNPGIKLRGTLRDAANIAANMIAWHYTSLSMAMYYDWRLNLSYNGAIGANVIFEQKPFKAFYSFKAFNELYKKGAQVSAVSNEGKVYALGAKDENELAVLIVNYTDEAREIAIEAEGADYAGASVLLIDETHTYEEATLGDFAESQILKLEKDAVALLKIPLK